MRFGRWAGALASGVPRTVVQHVKPTFAANVINLDETWLQRANAHKHDMTFPHIPPGSRGPHPRRRQVWPLASF